ncbi:MAG: glycosyltransferase family 2 protein [Desulfobacteraceae bacterium]
MKKAGLSIVIPAYNEAGSIGRLVSELRNGIQPDQIIVVDDGSEDGTATLAAEEGARVISHPVNIGNGASVKSGIRESFGSVLVFMDGDGQHDPTDIPKLLAELERFDMVVGARTRKQHASSARSLMNNIFNRLASYVTGHPVKDLTSGFRALRLHTAEELLPLLPNGYSWPTTSTLVMLRSGMSVKFVPVDARQRQSGRSRIRPVHDGIRFFMIIMKICTLYSPLRIFLPVSGSMVVAGLLNYAYTYLSSGRFTNMSALLFTGAIIIFMMGLLSEQISQISLLRHQVRQRSKTPSQTLDRKNDDGDPN